MHLTEGRKSRSCRQKDVVPMLGIRRGVTEFISNKKNKTCPSTTTPGTFCLAIPTKAPYSFGHTVLDSVHFCYVYVKKSYFFFYLLL